METYALEMRNKMRYLLRTLSIVNRMNLPQDFIWFLEKDAPSLVDRYEALLEQNKLLMIENSELHVYIDQLRAGELVSE